MVSNLFRFTQQVVLYGLRIALRPDSAEDLAWQRLYEKLRPDLLLLAEAFDARREDIATAPPGFYYLDPLVLGV